MIKYSSIKAGDVLYDYHSYQAGNTTRREWGNWTVKVLEINDRGAVVVWNEVNAPEQYSRRQLQRLRRKPGKERSSWGR